MSILALLGALSLGLIYSLMAGGLFVSFRVLNIADLTTEGSFAFGAAVSTVFTAGGHPFIGLLLGMVAGMLSGLITAFLQTKLKIQDVLAGILTTSGLYSVIYWVMGKPNIQLLDADTVFTPLTALIPIENKTIARYAATIITVAVIVIIFIVLLQLFFKTQVGLAIRATGDNEDMVRSSSINTNFTKTLGLLLANGLISLSGALFAQSLGTTEVNIGVGMVVVGLASLIIGEVVFSRKTVFRNLFGAVFGSVIYQIIVSFAYQTDTQTQNIKLLSACIVAIALAYPAIKNRFSLERRKKGGLMDAQNSKSV